MKKTVLLAGASAAGKSTLARAIGAPVISTSDLLRREGLRRGMSISEFANPDDLFKLGRELDEGDPGWTVEGAFEVSKHAVVDSIRSIKQNMWWSEDSPGGVVRVNVVCGEVEMERRHRARGTSQPSYEQFLFRNPDFTWHSGSVGLGCAVQVVRSLMGCGYADIVIGGQYGSEGKGKLCSLISPGYDALVRSGGPNAGHWVRLGKDKEYCFHSLPSGIMTNSVAKVYIAAGAALNQDQFELEVEDIGCRDRMVMDVNAMFITEADKRQETEIVGSIGSTGQGVGKAQQRRIERRSNPVGAWVYNRGHVSTLLLGDMADGKRVLLEGTQGSGLSLYHGPYPYVTSRDTNVGGMLSEVGIPPTWVRDVWMVVRPYPIRTGGNSGPLYRELTWNALEERLGHPMGRLSSRELTSTTKRLRRVGEFDSATFKLACIINNPTRLFLTFADYLAPEIHGHSPLQLEWHGLPPIVKRFVSLMEGIALCPVVGVSTGPLNHHTIWRPGYQPCEP